MPHDLQTQIASRILAGHIENARRLPESERSADIKLAWELAGELLQHRAAQPPRLDHLPPEGGSPTVKTKSQIVVRDPPPLAEWRASRRKPTSPAPGGTAGSPPKGPTLH